MCNIQLILIWDHKVKTIDDKLMYTPKTKLSILYNKIIGRKLWTLLVYDKQLSPLLQLRQNF